MGFVGQLQRYRDWLDSEAISAGGLGPAEQERLETRHITDSLLFSLAFEPGEHVLDVGSGVGLPGIPLAILLPETQFTLLDRAGRRVDLMRRAIRILGLDNVAVIHDDLANWSHPSETVVSRAAIPPERFLPVLDRIVIPNGTAVLGGSWNEAPEVSGYETKEIGSKILDQPVWVLIMRRT